MQPPHTDRRVIGIAGAPGAGKSTAAAALVARDPDRSVLVPMDGFHLADEALARLGRTGRKGAPDTFDVDGFVSLLERLRGPGTVYAPRFDRHLEAAVAGSIAVEPHHTLVVVEGNYLLHDRDGWERVRPLLDECWLLEVDDHTRRAELVARHVAHGRSATEATAWVDEVDERNAELIRRTAHRADRVVTRANAPDVAPGEQPGTR